MNKSKGKFDFVKIIMILFIIVAISLALLFYLAYSGKINITSTLRPENKYTENIVFIPCIEDSDSDGINDREDILNSALAYIQTSPKYKSKYYAGGYPDDGYGTCTDVVAYAFLGAGLDIMNLVQEDIALHPNDYNIETPDPNIDFRRVSNLEIYFKNNAISLTTDPFDIQQWQGGDIVIFKSHIGIVSDRRDKDGVTYIIHHDSPLQVAYEEAELRKRSDIIRHYRIGTTIKE